MPSRPLPSETFGGGQGFDPTPNAEHLAESAEVLRRLAQVVNDSAMSGDPKRVSLGHLLNNGMLSLRLYGFPILSIAGDQLADISKQGVDINYAVILNQPVSVQIEHTIAFLADFVSRQRYLRDLLRSRDRSAMRRVDLSIGELSRLSQESVIDDLAIGWEVSAVRVARRASELGIRLQVSYEGDLLPTYDNVAQRIPITKKIYNESEDARVAIDTTVGLIGGREMQIVGGGSEAMRSFLQQQLLVSSSRQYINHAVRDALVTGNGYLAFRVDQQFSFHNLDPERTRVRGRDRYQVAGPDNRMTDIDDSVIHLRGLRQPKSEYGVSLLEVFVGDYFQTKTFANLDASIPLDAPWRLIPQNRRQLEEIDDQRRRILQAQRSRFEDVLPFVRQQARASQADLYFPGYERYL